MTGEMQAYFRGQGEQVLERFHRLAPRIEAHYTGWSKRKVHAHCGSENKDVAEINIDQALEAKTLRLMLAPYVKAMIQGEGERILKELAVGAVFNSNDPAALKWLGTRMDMFSREVTGTTFDAIKTILRDGFSQGLPTSTIADQLRATFDTAEMYRAPLIARTETIAALNNSQLLAIEQAKIGDLIRKQWLSAGDEATRPTHLQAEADYAKGIPVDEMFEVGADKMLSPGNGSDPAENVNCRCTITYTRA